MFNFFMRPDLSPLRYPGGKRKLAPMLADLILLSGRKPTLFIEPFAQRARRGAHGFGHKIHELLIRGMRLLQVLFGHVTQGLRDFEWVIGHGVPSQGLR